MTIKQFLIMAVILAAMIWMWGCDSTSTERINYLEAVLEANAVITEGLDASIAELKGAMEILQEQLLLSEGEQAKKISEAIDVGMAGVKEQLGRKAILDEAAVKIQQEIKAIKENGEIGFGDELLIWGTTATHIGKNVPQPIGSYITLGGIIAGAIGAWYGKRNKAALVDVVGSVDRGLGNLSDNPESPKDAEGLMKSGLRTQQPATRNAVRKIKGTYK